MGKNIEYYLSKGFNIKMAEYFSKGRRTIVSVVANDDYTLTLEFDNGEKRLYNVAPLIKQDTVFENLAGLSNFSRVYVVFRGILTQIFIVILFGIIKLL